MTGLITRVPLIPWGRIGIAAGLIVCTALFAAWKIEERRGNKLQTQVIKWERAFAKLSNERNTQKVITRDRIIEVERKAKDARVRSKRLEAAPAANQCVTKPAVMGEDL